MSDAPQKKAVSICSTAADAAGDQVWFAFEYDDGSQAGVQCDAVRLIDMVNNLIDLGALAARQRAQVGGSGGAIHVIPREAVDVGASRGFGKDGIVFWANHCRGTTDPPCLTPDQAKAAIQALEKTLSGPAPSAASVMN